MVLVPKYSTEERECARDDCTALAVHDRKHCFKHLSRTRFEQWLGVHNRKMELARTLYNCLAFLMQVLILILLLI